MKWLAWFVVLLIVIGGGWYVWSGIRTQTATSVVSTQTFGMAEYTDPTYGFSFWYPSAEQVSASSTNDDTSFPGGTEVEYVQVGSPGDTYIAVVSSPGSTITDEPNNHASPIAQTKYFYDPAAKRWMIAYPEGSPVGNGATTTADISNRTIGGLPLLRAGARFDTSIVPLSTSEFLVIGDGGGSSFTPQLAQTVAASGADVDPSVQEAALQAEANAYASAQ